jgi:hypothetical protein
VRKFLPLLVFAAGCSSVATDVKHLTPQFNASTPPAQCRIISVLKDGAAQQAGLAIGDRILTIEGKAPEDAAAVADVINKAPEDVRISVDAPGVSTHTLTVHLHTAFPRLGAVCDLTGWNKSGVSSAGNESLTLFKGPFSFTLSGIVDDAKGLTLMRAHIVNHGNDLINVGPDLFTAKDGNGHEMPILTPSQVMCVLYGEKGARLLNQQPRRKQALDNDTAPALESTSDAALCSGVQDIGRLSKARMEYVEANAKSVAEDSLWPLVLSPGGTADGLIYAQAPGALPITVTVVLKGQIFTVALGVPQVVAAPIPAANLSGMLESMKRGTPLRVVLKKGRIFVAKFSSYDSLEEVAWFESTEGLLTSTSYPLRSIRSVEKLDR